MGRQTRNAIIAAAAILMVIVVATAVLAAGCDSSREAKDTVNLRQSDDGKTFTVDVGDRIQVVIPGNPTTGYTWTAALDAGSAALIQQVGEPLYTPDAAASNLVGSGGEFTFTFKAVAKGQALIKLDYSRPWESTEPAQTYTASLTIE